MMLATLLEVHRSARRADCEDRAFMLTAVGVPNRLDFDGLEYVLLVDEAQYADAVAHLERYAVESLPPPPAPPPQKLHPYAWVGCAFYALTLLVVGYAVAGGVWRLDAFDAGAIHAARIQAGEWWRAWTALTLHADAPHLIGNLGAGLWFGYLAGRQLGPGTTWLLTVFGAGVANLIEALIGPGSHRSIGASTAVFTVLGLLAAYTWRIRYELPQRWALRWGPLVAGAVMLALTGSGGAAPDGTQMFEGAPTDVVAHVSGFVVGAGIGAIAALPFARRALQRVPQTVSGAAAVVILAVAWILALRT